MNKVPIVLIAPAKEKVSISEIEVPSYEDWNELRNKCFDERVGKFASHWKNGFAVDFLAYPGRHLALEMRDARRLAEWALCHHGGVELAYQRKGSFMVFTVRSKGYRHYIGA